MPTIVSKIKEKCKNVHIKMYISDTYYCLEIIPLKSIFLYVLPTFVKNHEYIFKRI